MTYILASKNKHKAEEIKAILSANNFDCEIKTMDEAGLGDLEIIEDGNTFEENAAIKARAVFEKTNTPVIADDSGLCVDRLGGKPGIHTARFAGENATDDENIDKLLSELSGTEREERTAKFVCVIAFIKDNENEIEYSRGECRGYIATERHGVSGFGYDPIFYYPPKKMTLAELPDNEKNLVSHRYNALKSFAEKHKI